jgi:hypothetical protein
MSRWHTRLAELRSSPRVRNVQNVQNHLQPTTFEHFEQIEQHTEPVKSTADTWTAAHEERAAIIEHDGDAPRAWADALASLNPNRAPADVPPTRWLRFINDCGQFLDDMWAAKAAALGWGPVELFGCDRNRPFSRVDQQGLLWLLNGRRLVALTAESGIIETPSGGRLTYRRVSNQDGQVLAWALAP